MCGPHHCLGRDAFTSGPEILRRLLQLRQNASILEQGCTSHSPNSANRKHQITRHPWRTSPPLRPSLSFRYTQDRAYSLPPNPRRTTSQICPDLICDRHRLRVPDLNLLQPLTVPTI